MTFREAATRTDIARRVEYWRKRRGLTRQLFADRMGKSLSWVDMVRRGDRKLDRLSVLEEIASVLDISVYVLIDGEQAQRAAHCVDAAEVGLIKDGLQRYERITGVFATAEQPEPVDLTELWRQLNYAWLAFQASHYSNLGSLLGKLIVQAQHATVQAEGAAAKDAWKLLAQVYQVTTSTLRKLGCHDVEWLAAERAVLAAERSESPVLIGGAAFRLVNALRATDGARAAVDAANASAHQLEPHLDVERPEPSSLYGTLLLQGAIAAGLNNERQRATQFLDEAGRVASRLGIDRNDYWTAFGPTNVQIHRVSAHVAMNDGGKALEAADRIDESRLAMLPKERRANHLIDVAQAYSLAALDAQAVSALARADELAPKEVRCRPFARDLVHELWRRSPTAPSSALQRLVERVGRPA